MNPENPKSNFGFSGLIVYICFVIRRKLQDDIVRLLKQFPAVSILGPRQVGKTTLAKILCKNTDNVEFGKTCR